MSSAVHVRLLPMLLGTSFLLTLLACGRPQPRTEIIQRNGDVLASGSTPRVTDSVAGDVMLAGSQVTFSGATGGDYLGVGGSQVIGGRIHGSVRAAGGQIRVAAIVDHNLTVAGGNITLDSTATVGRNAYAAGGNIRIDGTVGQGVQISGRTVALNGRINGDVEVTAGELRVGPHAAIAGALRYHVSPRHVHIDPSARILGPVTVLPARGWRGTARFFRVLRLLWLLGFFVAGAVAVALAPRLADRAAVVLARRPAYSAVVGIVWLIVVPVAAVLVAMTLIGVPLALLAGAVYLILGYLGRAILAVWLGQVILGARVHPGRRGVLERFGLGAIILVLLAFLPGVGPVVMLVATILGLGALLLELREWTAMPLAL